MSKYYCFNAISEVGLSRFSKDYVKTEDLNEAEAVLVRSADLHETEFPEGLKVIARAGAGVNNIPLDKCAEKGIVVFNTPGANANAVNELVLMGMLLAYRHGIEGNAWIKANKDDQDITKNAEKAKKAFVGHELLGKTIGIIGVGAIGVKVAHTAAALGMSVIGFDAFGIPDFRRAQLPEGTKIVDKMEDVFAGSDFITVHVPLTDATRSMINKNNMAMMKDGVVILNFARNGIVDNKDVAEAMKSGKVMAYVCDFPEVETANMEGAIILPHLGASTDEAEENCAAMAVDEIVEFIEKGNVVNSVNFPSVSLERTGKKRATILFKGDSIVSKLNINVKNSKEATKNGYGVAIVDTDDDICPKCVSVEGVLKAQVI